MRAIHLSPSLIALERCTDPISECCTFCCRKHCLTKSPTVLLIMTIVIYEGNSQGLVRHRDFLTHIKQLVKQMNMFCRKILLYRKQLKFLKHFLSFFVSECKERTEAALLRWWDSVIMRALPAGLGLDRGPPGVIPFSRPHPPLLHLAALLFLVSQTLINLETFRIMKLN